MVDIKKIKALISMNDHTRKSLALILNISQTALKNKLDSKVDFKAMELKAIADRYNLKIDELYL